MTDSIPGSMPLILRPENRKQVNTEKASEPSILALLFFCNTLIGFTCLCERLKEELPSVSLPSSNVLVSTDAST